MEQEANGKKKASTTAIAARGDQAEQVIDLTMYPQEKYNLLVPTREVRAISPYHIISMVRVAIDPDPDNGMVYQIPGSDKLGLSRVSLDNIAQAAGVIWHPTMTKCALSDARRCIYEAVGGFRKPDGTFTWVKASKEINMDVIEREIRLQYKQKVAKNKMSEELAETNAERDIINYWKHMHARCDTGARSRVIRALFGVKSGYSPVELKKPFVVPTIQFSPWHDPEMAEQARRAFAYDVMVDYGGQPAPPPGVTLEECKQASQITRKAKSLPGPDWGPGEEIPATDEVIEAEEVTGAEDESSNGEENPKVCFNCGEPVNDAQRIATQNDYGHTFCAKCLSTQGTRG